MARPGPAPASPRPDRSPARRPPGCTASATRSAAAARRTRNRAGPTSRRCALVVTRAPLPPGTHRPGEPASTQRQAAPCGAVAVLHASATAGCTDSTPKNAPASRPRTRDRRPDTPRRTRERARRQAASAAPTRAPRAQRPRPGRDQRRMLAGGFERGDPAPRRQRLQDAARVGELAVLVGRGPQRPQHRQHQRAADGDERQQAEEDPPPAQVLGRPRRTRPARPATGTTQAVEIAANSFGPQRLGVHLADDDVDRGDQQAAAEPLDHPADDELDHRRRGARRDQPGDEQRPCRPTSGNRGPCSSLSCPDDHRRRCWRQERGERPAVVRQPCRSRAAVGSAGATAIASKAIRVIRISMPPLVARSRPLNSDSGAGEVGGYHRRSASFLAPDGQRAADQVSVDGPSWASNGCVSPCACRSPRSAAGRR